MANELLSDGHIHLFNAGFLPIEGFLMSRGVWKEAAEAFTNFIDNHIERDWPRAPLAELSASERERQDLYEMLEQELTGESDNHDADQPDLIKRVVGFVSEDELAALRVHLNRFRRGRETRLTDRAISGSAAISDDREALELLLRETAAQAGPVETGVNSLMECLPPFSLVDWILFLMIHESRLEKAYGQAWDGDHSVGLRVHHMMDMENHYKSKRVLYSLPERHKRMLELAKRAGSTLLGFTAFDPFRNDCLAIIEAAIGSGFRGVKFYPPNGYRPIGNHAGDIQDGPSHEVVNDRNLAFFQWCAMKERDIPIFTHCTESGAVESRPGTGKFADPAGWGTVLEQDGLGSLRLCFGHAGGQEGWFAKSEDDFNNSYAGEVFRLCTKYPNVYCDFGYFDCVLRERKAKAFIVRLTAAIEAAPVFANKCCFGTDWHMLAKLNSRKYISRFLDIMEATEPLRQHKVQFFGGNLRNYLKIS